MRIIPLMRSGLLVASLVLATSSLQAADGCAAYKWDASREVQLHATQPTAVAASADPAAAPSITIDRLYALTLRPQGSVQYPMAPSKKTLADGAFGGMLKLKVERAGHYRLAIDSGYWLDVVHAGKQLDAADFNGSATCAGPRKIVVYDLPAGDELVVQIAAATGAQARLSVTPVVPSP